MIMIVYRVEHPETGEGLFRYAINKSFKLGDQFDEEFDSLMKRHSRFPMPFDENLFLTKNGKNWFCAYPSRKDLQKWISPQEIKKLILEWGFKIYRLEVREVQVGTFQIIFTKDSVITGVDVTENFLIEENL